jgi:secreted protein with Ig-like and vWFA domain
MFLDEFEPDDLFTLLDLDFPVIRVLEVPIGIEVNFAAEFAGIIGGDIFSFPFYEL